MELNILVGTYNNDEDDGIRLLEPESDLEDVKTALKGGIEDKSNNYLAYDSDKNVIYSSQQMDGVGGVATYKIDWDKNNINLESCWPTGADRRPSHIRIGPEKEYLISANYEGSISINPIDDNGYLKEKSDFVQISDDELGSHKRQDSPHPHSVNIFSGEEDQIIYVPDLGTDKVLSYKITSEGQITELDDFTIELENERGPRHMEIREDLKMAYVINELDPSITVLELNPKTGEPNIMENVDIASCNTEDEVLGADIVSYENSLYASVRGEDKISIFQIQEDGSLQSIGEEDSGGESPRNLGIASNGEKLVAGNRDSNNITIFERNNDSGVLNHQKNFKVPEPAYVDILPSLDK